MKNIFACFMLAASVVCNAQKNPVEQITQLITVPETSSQVQFLAADELNGRDTGSPGQQIAANYIASIFKANKVLPAAENASFFQNVPFLKITPPQTIELKLNEIGFQVKTDVVQLFGSNIDIKSDVVYVGYGSATDFAKTDVKGKIVMALMGTENENNMPKAVFADTREKNKLAQSGGAVALIEIWVFSGTPFTGIANYAHKEKMTIQEEIAQIPHLIMRSPDDETLKQLKDNKKVVGSLTIQGTTATPVLSKNVIGKIEGTDPALKNEYIILSAHYDHVGIGKKNAENDSIYNGARDNALGTVALLSAVKYFGQYPLKRSILLIAFTGEEKGLLGSNYYADHPVIPLKNCVMNINSDGAGYNDKSIVTINGFEYTDTKKEIEKACTPFGVKAIQDPMPQMGLYARSDNFSFANKGVPAINFAPGVTGMEPEIMKYYHQADDEAETLDFEYLVKYFRAYVSSALTLGNVQKVPGWLPGNQYEAKGKSLYGLK